MSNRVRQAHTARSALCDIVQLVVVMHRMLVTGKPFAAEHAAAAA